MADETAPAAEPAPETAAPDAAQALERAAPDVVYPRHQGFAPGSVNARTAAAMRGQGG